MVAIAVERGQGDTYHASSQVQPIFRNRAPSRLMRRLYFRDDAKTAHTPTLTALVEARRQSFTTKTTPPLAIARGDVAVSTCALCDSSASRLMQTALSLRTRAPLGEQAREITRTHDAAVVEIRRARVAPHGQEQGEIGCSS